MLKLRLCIPGKINMQNFSLTIFFILQSQIIMHAGKSSICFSLYKYFITIQIQNENNNSVKKIYLN